MVAPEHITAEMLARATHSDPDEWSYNHDLSEWSSDRHECDGPSWIVEDEEAPRINLSWGDLTMSWYCDSIDQLPEMMTALRRGADAFNQPANT